MIEYMNDLFPQQKKKKKKFQFWMGAHRNDYKFQFWMGGRRNDYVCIMYVSDKNLCMFSELVNEEGLKIAEEFVDYLCIFYYGICN